MPAGKKVNVQEFDELKRKYLTVDRNYEALKTLTRNGESCCTSHNGPLTCINSY